MLYIPLYIYAYLTYNFHHQLTHAHAHAHMRAYVYVDRRRFEYLCVHAFGAYLHIECACIWCIFAY